MQPSPSPPDAGSPGQFTALSQIVIFFVPSAQSEGLSLATSHKYPPPFTNLSSWSSSDPFLCSSQQLRNACLSVIFTLSLSRPGLWSKKSLSEPWDCKWRKEGRSLHCVGCTTDFSNMQCIITHYSIGSFFKTLNTGWLLTTSHSLHEYRSKAHYF